MNLYYYNVKIRFGHVEKKKKKKKKREENVQVTFKKKNFGRAFW